MVWCDGAAGSGAPRKGDLALPGAAEETDDVRWEDDLPGLGRNGPPCERGTGVDAGYQGEREQALTFEYWYLATTLMRAGPRSLGRSGGSRYGGGCRRSAEGSPALSAPTAGTAVSWAPGTLLAGFTPAEVWRNSDQVKLYLGGTVPEVVWQARPATRLEVPGRPRAKRLRRLAARTALTLPASH